jgi:flagellar hook-associated protein 1
MSLQTAFYAARSALIVNSAQTSTVSRNIAGIGEPGYARRLVLVESTSGGEIRTEGIDRASNVALRDAMLSATSSSSADDAIASGLSSLQQTLGGTQSTQSPSALINSLKSALIQAAAAPQDLATLNASVDAARSVVSNLNAATTQVQETRRRADADMMSSVNSINSLLEQFGEVNAQIVNSKNANVDSSDAADRRDAILTGLAKEIGIKTVLGGNGGVSIYTDNGVTLFQGGARKVEMQASPALAADIGGHAVLVDGIAVTGSSARPPVSGGAIAGYAAIRDSKGPTYQAQLDEIARGLVSAFSQTDQVGSSAPVRTGLFAWAGSPSMPVGSVAGLAGTIAIDPSVDPGLGGSATLLRDGGIGAAPTSAYNYNSTGAAAYADRLRGMTDAIDATQTFDVRAGLATKSGVADLATSSVGWMEAQRKNASEAGAQSSALVSQMTSALSNATGVNIDDQMSQMLDLEHSYQASAKLIAAVDSMYSALFSSMPMTP